MTSTRVDPLQPGGLRHRCLASALKWIPPLRYVLLRRGLLKTSGWVASAWANAPVDSHGEPVAWYTYAALKFLEPRIHNGMDVFEFGAGHSTLWWARRVRSVRSVENDRVWVERLADRLPANASVVWCDLEIDGEYAKSAVSTGRAFDVVVIDGYDRNNCALRVLPALKPDGVIIWDNSDWTHFFAQGLAFLTAQGFRRIDFSGLGPLNGYEWTTSVFYRPDNVLGI